MVQDKILGVNPLDHSQIVEYEIVTTRRYLEKNQ
jgi:hypothetical protein